MKKTDLDVAKAQDIPKVLRNAAQEYYSTAELELAWQDTTASVIWSKMAKELERSAAKIDILLKKYNIEKV